MENLLREERKVNKKRKRVAKSKLSFAVDDEDEEEESTSRGASRGDTSQNDDGAGSKRSKFGKNPSVDTSFLPDRDREEEERRERERLRREWLTRQETMKLEDIEITYSYWDGSGHRKTVVVSLFFVLFSVADWLTFQVGARFLVQERRLDSHFLGEMSSAVPRDERCQCG